MTLEGNPYIREMQAVERAKTAEACAEAAEQERDRYRRERDEANADYVDLIEERDRLREELARRDAPATPSPSVEPFDWRKA